MKWKFWKKEKDKTIVKAKIKITVPEGKAEKINKRFGRLLRIFILARVKPKETIIDNKTILWEIKTSLTESYNINKRLGQFDGIVKGIFNSKLVGKAISKKFSKEEQEEVKEMLLNHTKIELQDFDEEETNHQNLYPLLDLPGVYQ